jgi:tRNA 2-selenouridine synthase
MAFHPTSIPALLAAGFDDLVDARSPAEYAEDHLPGAINLPVLDNDERARVGTMYVQESRFGARRMGAALVLKNIAAHLDGPLADRPGGWRPLVYCWRGGQRSGTFGWLMREIGWRAETLAGGYRTWRRLVVRALYDEPLAPPLVLLGGMTCTGKTAILDRLPGFGVQVLDLEGLARHRGSVFGAVAGGQPAQKAFESAIALALARIDPARPVVVEAESSKVGDLIVPPSLWSAMCAAPRIELSAPLAARAAFFPDAYPDLVADPAAFAERIARLHPLHGAAKVARWQGMVAEGAFVEVAADLMRAHYDPRYAKSSARFADNAVARIGIEALDPAGLDATAGEIAAAVARIARG